MWKLLFAIALCSVNAQKDPHFWENRNGIVHLFEWKFADIANECEGFLAPKGYGGVQVSPVHEYVVIQSPVRPWWERYQPVSYKIISRSGDERAFANMVKRCNDVGIRVYVDVVFNHMTGDYSPSIGMSGTVSDTKNRQYPGVPFGPGDFHWPVCDVTNYQDASNVRNCELSALHDLNQGSPYVRDKVVEFLNHLVHLGVAGFRIDAAKHMWPEDLKVIFARVDNLNTTFGFAEHARAFTYMEVPDWGQEAVSKTEYSPFSTVTEFKYSGEIKSAFVGDNKLKYLVSWGPEWGFLQDGNDALVFVNNHDTQRRGSLSYKMSKNFKMANAFMMADPYGHKKIMSSFDFADRDQGPPMDEDQNILSPWFRIDGTCTNGWICEHRWRQVYNMVQFSNVVRGTTIQNWWDDGNQQIAFSRGNMGFIAFTLEGDLQRTLQTGLPEGRYCDVISGMVEGNHCTGKTITVHKDSSAYIELLENEEDGVLAIHAQQKL